MHRADVADGISRREPTRQLPGLTSVEAIMAVPPESQFSGRGRFKCHTV